jgi:pimeloyl-ACP methyl ester carboxylesterase
MKHLNSVKVVFFFTFVWLVSCAGSDNVPAYVDPTDHRSGFVTTKEGVRLHCLDFGGTGEAMVLLAGAGNSAHVFDEFAPRFTDRFHVYAFTRRGFGESSQPQFGYGTETLAEDILDVLDGIKISKAHLVGHSLAGTEMTFFAGKYPERVSRLVYLDAAYDLVDQKSIADQPAAPQFPDPHEKDLMSAAAFGTYVALTQGVALPEPEIHAINLFSPNGRFFSSVTHPAIFQAIIDGESHMDYTGLKSPALAIYTVPDVLTDMYPWMTPTSPDWDLANASFLAAQSSLAVQRQKFTEKAPAATSSVIEMHGVPHYLFLAKPDEVFEMVRTFLLTP